MHILYFFSYYTLYIITHLSIYLSKIYYAAKHLRISLTFQFFALIFHVKSLLLNFVLTPQAEFLKSYCENWQISYNIFSFPFACRLNSIAVWSFKLSVRFAMPLTQRIITYIFKRFSRLSQYALSRILHVRYALKGISFDYASCIPSFNSTCIRFYQSTFIIRIDWFVSIYRNVITFIRES